METKPISRRHFFKILTGATATTTAVNGVAASSGDETAPQSSNLFQLAAALEIAPVTAFLGFVAGVLDARMHGGGLRRIARNTAAGAVTPFVGVLTACGPPPSPLPEIKSLCPQCPNGVAIVGDLKTSNLISAERGNDYLANLPADTLIVNSEVMVPRDYTVLELNRMTGLTPNQLKQSVVFGHTVATMSDGKIMLIRNNDKSTDPKEVDLANKLALAQAPEYTVQELTDKVNLQTSQLNSSILYGHQVIRTNNNTYKFVRMNSQSTDSQEVDFAKKLSAVPQPQLPNQIPSLDIIVNIAVSNIATKFGIKQDVFLAGKTPKQFIMQHLVQDSVREISSGRVSYTLGFSAFESAIEWLSKNPIGVGIQKALTANRSNIVQTTLQTAIDAAYPDQGTPIPAAKVQAGLAEPPGNTYAVRRQALLQLARFTDRFVKIDASTAKTIGEAISEASGILPEGAFWGKTDAANLRYYDVLYQLDTRSFVELWKQFPATVKDKLIKFGFFNNNSSDATSFNFGLAIANETSGGFSMDELVQVLPRVLKQKDGAVKIARMMAALNTAQQINLQSRKDIEGYNSAIDFLADVTDQILVTGIVKSDPIHGVAAKFIPGQPETITNTQRNLIATQWVNDLLTTTYLSADSGIANLLQILSTKISPGFLKSVDVPTQEAKLRLFWSIANKLYQEKTGTEKAQILNTVGKIRSTVMENILDGNMSPLDVSTMGRVAFSFSAALGRNSDEPLFDNQRLMMLSEIKNISDVMKGVPSLDFSSFDAFFKSWNARGKAGQTRDRVNRFIDQLNSQSPGTVAAYLRYVYNSNRETLNTNSIGVDDMIVNIMQLMQERNLVNAKSDFMIMGTDFNIFAGLGLFLSNLPETDYFGPDRSVGHPKLLYFRKILQQYPLMAGALLNTGYTKDDVKYFVGDPVKDGVNFAPQVSENQLLPGEKWQALLSLINWSIAYANYRYGFAKFSAVDVATYVGDYYVAYGNQNFGYAMLSNIKRYPAEKIHALLLLLAGKEHATDTDLEIKFLQTKFPEAVAALKQLGLQVKDIDLTMNQFLKDELANNSTGKIYIRQPGANKANFVLRSANETNGILAPGDYSYPLPAYFTKTLGSLNFQYAGVTNEGRVLVRVVDDKKADWTPTKTKELMSQTDPKGAELAKRLEEHQLFFLDYDYANLNNIMQEGLMGDFFTPDKTTPFGILVGSYLWFIRKTPYQIQNQTYQGLQFVDRDGSGNFKLTVNAGDSPKTLTAPEAFQKLDLAEKYYPTLLEGVGATALIAAIALGAGVASATTEALRQILIGILQNALAGLGVVENKTVPVAAVKNLTQGAPTLVNVFRANKKTAAALPEVV